MSIPYRFMPTARRGLARAHREVDAPAGPLAVRPRVTIGLTLQASQDGSGAGVVSGGVDLALYGPGDVIGLDPRLIVRTEPKPGVTNFEPNYLAAIDFDPPDLPWLLTPARANAHRVRPWLVLVVLDRAVVSSLPTLAPGRPLPSLALTAAQVASELPDLGESWLWAHAQAVSPIVSPVPNDPSHPAALGALAAELKARPERNVSRLVCPRRLQPRHDYLACLVPAFEAGRLRGLGQTVRGETTGPAWNQAAPAATELPVYFHWQFSTGPKGDIETLARRLRTPARYANDTSPAGRDLLARLSRIGIQPVAVDGDHLLFDGLRPDRTVFEGAMVPLGYDPEPASRRPLLASRLQTILNSGSSQAATGTQPAREVPTLSPPIYGEHPARRHSVDGTRLGRHWLDDLSLQPRYRLAAGWGAEVVRRNQDAFLQDAWRQVGEVLAAERALSLSRLSRDVLRSVEKRHLARLSESRLMALTAPARSRIRLEGAESLHGRIAGVTLPAELFDASMRRLTSARRPALRMARWRDRELQPSGVVQQMAGLVAAFAAASTRRGEVDPNRFVPDGIVGSRDLDRIPLPADGAALVDLRPFTGLDVQLPAAEVRALQQASGSLRSQALVARRRLPLMGDIQHEGILTETHRLRFAELQRAMAQPLAADPGTLVRQVSRSGAEGVLLSVEPNGQLQARAVRIDGRNGALMPVGRSSSLSADGKLRRSPGIAATVAAGSLGKVPVRALRLYGNGAVFESLPPGALGGAETAIRLESPGRFTAPVAVEGPVSITLPPAIKDREVLQRYSAAFRDYQQLWMDPQEEEKVFVRPIDLAVSATVALVRTRLDPAQTVPNRLASRFTLAQQPVSHGGDGLASEWVSSRLDLALRERLRYVIPPCLDRVMAYPHLTFPLSRRLEEFAPEVFLPGVGELPDDFLMVLQTNPRFVEALMLGANHEMGRELLWQGFPTDCRGTPFRHFWQRLDGRTDIEPIHLWGALPLGKQNPANSEFLVLLIRGQLLERFPNLSIYAYPITGAETRPGEIIPPVAPGKDPTSLMHPDRVLLPILRGHLGKDITYLGFDLAPKDLDSHFFVLEEQMSEPRFGFDEPDADGRNTPSWLDVDWSEVGVEPGRHFGAAALKRAPPAQGPRWIDPHSATVAGALLQRPFRGFYRGSSLRMPTLP